MREEWKLIEEEKILSSNTNRSRARKKNVSTVDRTGETTFDQNLLLFSSIEKDFDIIYNTNTQRCKFDDFKMN